ncbi:PITH domain-containing protein 1 [Daldinia childiae]|uniref:PITH domain-containing protein 1 n=1 Tax=Daldinia childiae TaxID=326645 RepID=UPI001446C251|nr:PITH domain-containing protein 1 [Daldinia childiae]KAF3070934.1 PITH domain-containing protein 1 [Daldinia childiae]
MSNCREEHEHGGDHHHNHEHDHTDDIVPTIHHSLYQHIIFDQITTLNEAQGDSGRKIIEKTWAESDQLVPELQSDADEQLIINVPFTGQVKLHTILIRAPLDQTAPRLLKVFSNREDVDFDVASEMTPTQTFELSQFDGVQEVAVRRALFGNVRRLALFVEDNFGEETTRISYLAFKGDWLPIGRAPVNILYEAAARPSDHKVKGTAAYRRLDSTFNREG